MRILLAMLTMCVISGWAHAEKAQKFGNLEIHYNALTTNDLLPEVARMYKIERSNTRGLLTISVLKKNDMGVALPVPAKISMFVTNMTQQLSPLVMREIKEGTAVYYLAEFRVAAPDTLTFTGVVETAGEPRREVKFSQRFYK